MASSTVDSNNNLSFISDLNPEKDLWNMKARTIRKWRQSYRMDLILLDEKVRRDTTHYDGVANTAASGVHYVGLSSVLGVSFTFGVLTCEDIDQLLIMNSAGDKAGNKDSDEIHGSKVKKIQLLFNFGFSAPTGVVGEMRKEFGLKTSIWSIWFEQQTL